jgi:hypothetical protein
MRRSALRLVAVLFLVGSVAAILFYTAASEAARLEANRSGLPAAARNGIKHAYAAAEIYAWMFDEEGWSDYVSGRARIDRLAMLDKIVFTKSVAWTHEREWRVFSGVGRDPNATFEDIPFGALELDGLIVGCSLNQGEVFVVPKGVEHRPVARGEVHILLIEPTGTPNTGDKATAAPRILA